MALTVGSDVAVTAAAGHHGDHARPRPVARRPAGVQAVEQVQHRLAYVGPDLQDLYGIDARPRSAGPRPCRTPSPRAAPSAPALARPGAHPRTARWSRRRRCTTTSCTPATSSGCGSEDGTGTYRTVPVPRRRRRHGVRHRTAGQLRRRQPRLRRPGRPGSAAVQTLLVRTDQPARGRRRRCGPGSPRPGSSTTSARADGVAVTVRVGPGRRPTCPGLARLILGLRHCSWPLASGGLVLVVGSGATSTVAGRAGAARRARRASAPASCWTEAARSWSPGSEVGW